MPELPDIVVYLEAIERRVQGEILLGVRIRSPFLLRTVDPPIRELEGRRVAALRRLGKRIVIGLEGELFVVLHLMVAGRLRWQAAGSAIPKKAGLAAFDFSPGSLVLTEAGAKRRASLHLVRGEQGLAAYDRGGLEVLECTQAQFRNTLRSENHTLKRALTDPRLLSGIGNAYSDEILHRARLSPVKLTSALVDEELGRLWHACRGILGEWTERLRADTGGAFPEHVTAFREGMAVHGRYGQPCPACGSLVQRIVHAANETNYCPGCQTQGKLLADRALSRLLRSDWPRTLEELEEMKARQR
jgi:formamidopyrimidine-DNA glycosylase